jgi:hypothetical protein
MRMTPGTNQVDVPGRVPECRSNGRNAMWHYLDLPGGECKVGIPSASYRSWVFVRGDDVVSELAMPSIKRAPGAPMSEIPLTRLQ